MIYKMKINEKAFMRMESGDKKIEYRVNDFKIKKYNTNG